MAEEKKIVNETDGGEVAKVKESKAKKPQEKKPGIFKKLGKFFRECKSEMKKIVWSSKKQTFNNTVVVIASMLVIGAIVVGLDYLFSWIIQGLISL